LFRKRFIANKVEENMTSILNIMRDNVLNTQYNAWHDGKIENRIVDKQLFDSLTKDLEQITNADENIANELSNPGISAIEKQQVICEGLLLRYLNIIDNTSIPQSEGFAYSYFYNELRMQITAMINEMVLGHGKSEDEQLKSVKKSWSIILIMDEAVRISNLIDAYNYLSVAEQKIDPRIAEESKKAYTMLLGLFNDEEDEQRILRNDNKNIATNLEENPNSIYR